MISRLPARILLLGPCQVLESYVNNVKDKQYQLVRPCVCVSKSVFVCVFARIHTKMENLLPTSMSLL